jgi:hypothetical protein
MQHGCEYDSNSLSPTNKKTLHSNLSVTESDYLKATPQTKHQEAPKFRRNNHNGNGVSNRGSNFSNRKNMSAQAMDIPQQSSPLNVSLFILVMYEY